MDAIHAMYEDWVAGHGQDHDDWGNVTVEPGGVDYREVADRAALWVEPHGADDGRVLVYIHGGGFVGGSLWTHRKLAGHLAKSSGLRTLLVTYPHAPEHAYPAPVEACLETFRWVLDQGLSVVALGGDSCGAAVALQVALRQPGAGALLLISPWVDLTGSASTIESNRHLDRYFTRELIDGLVSMYLQNGEDAADPAVSPLFADLTGLPPMFVQAGADESGLDDAVRLAERARSAGVEVRLDVFAGMPHSFQMAAGRMPVADDAIRRFGTWLSERS